MRLTELEAEFLHYYTDTDGHVYHKRVDSIGHAHGVMFLCPKCFKANSGKVGTHSIICWSPSVPELAHPRPGRWSLHGTSLEDLSLVAASSSVQLVGGCNWHGFVTNGEVRDA